MKISNSTNFNPQPLKNTSFRGVYSLKGSSKTLQKAIDNVALELEGFGSACRFKAIETDADSKTVAVLTEEDIDSVDKDWFNSFALRKLIQAEDLLDPFKILKMNFVDGVNEKVQKIYQDNKEFVCSVLSQTYNKIREVNMIRFNQPKPLIEALSELFAIPSGVVLERNSYEFKHGNIPWLLNHRKFIENSALSDIKIKGLCGRGGFSTAYEMADGKCLKLSFDPNAPLQDAAYDIPTIDKNKIKLTDEDSIYYAIQQKGLNNKEIRMGQKEVNEIAGKIVGDGNYYDTRELKDRQIAIFKGEPYLVDAQVALGRELYT